MKEKRHLDTMVTFRGTYDLIGDIAVLRVPDHIKATIHVLAETILQAHKNVKTVLCGCSVET